MKILTAVVFFAVALFVPACSAQETAPKAEGTATVYFYRLREYYANALKPSIYADKKQVARMRNGRFVTITLPSGEHTITSTFPGSGLILTVHSGETYYVRLDMSKPALFHNARGEVTQVTEGQGKFEVAQLKPAEPEDLKEDPSADKPADQPKKESK